MQRFLVFSAVGQVTAAPKRDFTSYSYDDYVVEFKGSGSKVGASETRRAIFEKNLEMINAHNSGDSSWWAGVNQFTDMTNDEFRASTRGRKEKVFDGQPHPHVLRSSAADLPASKDYRDDSLVTPTKDQGSCGSCWAFSAAETFESHLAIQTQTAIQYLSPQQIVSCSPNPDQCGGSGGCDGSTQPLAFDYTKNAGLTTEANYPYQGATGTCDTSKIKPVAYNAGYAVLPRNDYTALMDAVANVGPVAISIAAGGSAFQYYSGGVLSNCNDFVMDHAVQLVGYGTDSGKDYWLVRNSWGSWGESGYIRMQRYGEGKEPCGTDNKPQDGDACQGDTTPRQYCGECGILSASSYPTNFTTVQPPPSPPPPTPTPAPTPIPVPTPIAPTPPTPPSPGPVPVPHDCDDFNIEDQPTCESYLDQTSGDHCQWCYLSGLDMGYCVTPAEGTAGCFFKDVAV